MESTSLNWVPGPITAGMVVVTPSTTSVRAGSFSRTTSSSYMRWVLTVVLRNSLTLSSSSPVQLTSMLPGVLR